jgi:hypothetical protein
VLLRTTALIAFWIKFAVGATNDGVKERVTEFTLLLLLAAAIRCCGGGVAVISVRLRENVLTAAADDELLVFVDARLLCSGVSGAVTGGIDGIARWCWLMLVVDELMELELLWLFILLFILLIAWLGGIGGAGDEGCEELMMWMDDDVRVAATAAADDDDNANDGEEDGEEEEDESTVSASGSGALGRWTRGIDLGGLGGARWLKTPFLRSMKHM